VAYNNSTHDKSSLMHAMVSLGMRTAEIIFVISTAAITSWNSNMIFITTKYNGILFQTPYVKARRTSIVTTRTPRLTSLAWGWWQRYGERGRPYRRGNDLSRVEDREIVRISSRRLFGIFRFLVTAAFRFADDVLRLWCSTSEIVVRPGLINVDFANVRDEKLRAVHYRCGKNQCRSCRH